MSKILTVEQMRATEAAADTAGLSYETMMAHAGRIVADRVKQLLEDYTDPRVTVLVGKGNNGGDGLVAARLIAAETEAVVSIFLTEPRDESDPLLAEVRKSELLIADAATDGAGGYRVLRTMIANADIVIDAILGTGAKLPIKGELKKILAQIDRALKDRKADHPHLHLTTPIRPTVSGARDPIIVAIDLPTGLDADTGELDPSALYAAETITLEAAKPGLLTFPGAAAVGTLHIGALGIPEKTEPAASVKHTLVDASVVRALLPERPANANKGTFGKALIAAGSINYTGAAALAALSAYRVGAGLVTVAAPQPIIPMLAAHLVEATWLLLPHDMGVLSKGAARVLREEMAGYTAMLIGPGLGQEEPTAEFIEALFQSETVKVKTRSFGFSAAPVATAEMPNGKDKGKGEGALPPLVIDADGLNLLAKIESWWTRLPARTVLTPHPGEFARLAHIEDKDDEKATDVVAKNRIGLAAEKAAAWNMIVVLKGAYTVIADPDGRVAVLPFANPGLARAGTGDVLAGMIVGLLAGGLDPFDAAVLGGYLHGYAGELATSYVGHPASVLAGDVAAHISDALATVSAVSA